MTDAWTRFLGRLSTTLDEAEAEGRRRRQRPVAREPGGWVRLADGRRLVDVSSNDYLGLALHPQVRARAADYAQRLGAGAPASRLVTGTLPEHLQVEQRLAAFKGAEESGPGAGHRPAPAATAWIAAVRRDRSSPPMVRGGVR